MSGWTKGPWAVSPFRAEVVCDKFGNDGDFLPVCQMLWPTKERSEAETYANGKLLAAAPDLYEACAAIEERRQCGDRTDTDYVFALVDAALAKARGEVA